MSECMSECSSRPIDPGAAVQMKHFFKQDARPNPAGRKHQHRHNHVAPRSSSKPRPSLEAYSLQQQQQSSGQTVRIFSINPYKKFINVKTFHYHNWYGKSVTDNTVYTPLKAQKKRPHTHPAAAVSAFLGRWMIN
jgi:hypothetical protein